MEKPTYRENLGLIQSMYPGRAAISVTECAKVLGCAKNTIYAYINRAKNPLPTKRILNKKLIIPIASLAHWLSQ